MGKTPSPGKWIKSLLGKKSSKSSLEKGSEKLKSVKKEEVVVNVKDNNVTNIPTNPPAVVSSQEVVSTQTITVPEVVIVDKQPSEEIVTDESNVNVVESSNDSEELKLEEAATKVQSALRARQAREEFETLKGVIKVQAVIRGHLVRRQAVATYSSIWGIVKLQALVRGKKARSSDTGVQFEKTNTETENSETLQGSTYNWLDTPTKVSMIDKILISSPTTLPLKIQYGPEDPNSVKKWLERWTHLRVWAPGPLVIKNLVSKSQTKKRSFQAVESDKGKLKKGAVKKPSGSSNTGQSSSNEKPKRVVRKASTLGKELTRIENDKSKQSSRKSTSAIKDGSSLEVKDEKPRISLKKAPLSNGIEKPTRKSAEKKKESANLVQKEVSGDKVSASVVDTPPEVEKTKESPETVSKEADLETDMKSLVVDNTEQEELKTAEKSDKAEEEILEPDVVEISSENGHVVASENAKPNDRRASLPAMIENHHQDDGLAHSGRKIPSYMAPTASAKARIRGQGSPRLPLEKPEKNGTTTRRHSLPPAAANGKLGTMSPRAHRLLIASAKGSMNSDRSFSSSKDIGEKSGKAEWKR